ncbi:TcdA/TcdB pore-forming domain-containing protein [Pseudomonas sp. H1h]|uniref:TcdA/TcdB pore-forming domain-containing protein n=1 Tax=Pseudomonas sp. H1h TaxID=1397280 RepID=UPI00046A045F|nr:TcdA/TcdB pore-forming domain-containing protein [Pseudomonas sp. H1h]
MQSIDQNREQFVNFVDLFKLKDLEQALSSHKGSQHYDSVLRYYFACVGKLESPELMEPLALLKQTLELLRGPVRVPRASDVQAPAAADLPQICEKIEGFETRLRFGIEQMKIPPTAVPKAMHFVWLGGGIGEIQRDYLNVWRQVLAGQGYSLNLWYGSDALLAHQTNKLIVEAAKADALLQVGDRTITEDELATLYEERAMVLKQQMFEHINTAVAAGQSADDARIDLLTRAYGQEAGALEALLERNRHSLLALAGEDLNLRDVGDAGKPLQLQDIYLRETRLRGNLAAASDIVRVEALFNEGGVYADVDNLPALAQRLGTTDISEWGGDARMGALQLLLDHNPHWMPGRQALRSRYTDYFDSIPVQHRAQLEAFAKAGPTLGQVFELPVPGMARAHELRAVVDGASLSNAFLQAHPRAAMLESVIERMRFNYEVIDEATYLAVRRGVARIDFDGMIQLAREVLERTYGPLDRLSMEQDISANLLASAAAGYFSDGIRLQSEWTIYLTGPGAMRSGMADYDRQHFTAAGAQAAREQLGIAPLAMINRATEEEQDHSWKDNETDPQKWLADEQARWQAGQYPTRYLGDVAQLLKHSTIEFDNGWPLIEGRPVLLSDILQKLVDTLGEPFIRAMRRSHNGPITFETPLPLSFDDRQAIKAQPVEVLAPGSLSDPKTQLMGLDELLSAMAKGTLHLAHASPLQRLTLGMLLGAQTLDNRRFALLAEELDNLANSVVELGASNRYAAIERQLYKRRTPAFMAGMASVFDEPMPVPGSALALKDVALSQAHTPFQWGRQVARIRQRATLEHQEHIVERTEQVLEEFNGTHFKPVPQDLLLHSAGEAVGGRCYPLALVVSAALTRGEQAFGRLRERFYLAVVAPEQSDSLAFLDALEQLRDVQLRDVGQALGRVNLAEVTTRLERYSGHGTFMLNSDNHAMLVAKTVDAGQANFHFYDPNFGLFKYASPAMFKQGLADFFLKQGMAGYYGAYGEPAAPEFDLIEVHGQQVAALQVSGGFSVGQLLESDALPQQPSLRPIRRRLASAHGQSLVENAHLGRSLLELDSRWWGQQIAHVTAGLQDLHDVPKALVPVFETLEITAEGRYRMSLFDPSNGQFVTQVISDEPRLLRIKDYLTEQFATLGRKPGGPGGLPDPSEVASVHTLNAGFTIQALMNALRKREGDDRTLTLAVRLHAYVNYAQLAHGTFMDVAGVVKLVQTALSEEKAIARTCAPVVGEALGHVANEGVGALLGLANVGFDIYQLATAENDVDKAQFGTQLAFDSAGLVLTGAGLAAAATGAATAAAVLGGVGVMFGGLAVGVAALAQGFASIARDAQAVGLFFDALKRSAYGVGYRFDEALQSWVVQPSSLSIECLDLKAGRLLLGRPKLLRLRDHFGVPDCDPDDAKAIDIRQQLGLPGQIRRVLPAGQRIILPCTPQAYYGYEYKALPFASWRHDTGFETARQLEKKGRDGQWQFLFTFYSFPSHYIVQRLLPSYRDTLIRVLLDAADRELVVPDLPQAWQGKVSYELTGAGASCSLSLTRGIKVELQAPGISDRCRWVLVATWATQSDVLLGRYGALSVGGVEVTCSGKGRHEVLVRLADQRLFRLDRAALTFELLEDTAPPGLDESALLQHYKTLAREHRLALPYTPVRHYLIPFESPQKPRYTTAWYDAGEDRFLYIRNEQVQADKALLGAVVDGFAYFHETENAFVWQVDAVSGLLKHRYRLLQMPGKSSVLSIEADEHGVIHVVQTLVQERHETLQYRFLIHQGQLLLSSITHDMNRRLSLELSGVDTLNRWQQVVGDYLPQLPEPEEDGATTIDWEPASYVSVCWMFEPNMRDMVWIRSRDRLLIHPVPRPKRARGWPDSIKNLNDLMLLTLAQDSDLFVVYDRPRQRLCRLERTVSEGKSNWSHAWLEPSGLQQVVAVGDAYQAVTEDGLFFNLNRQGEVRFGGVTEQWLKGRAHWWQALDAVLAQYPVEGFAILGLRNTQVDAPLCAWYVDQRLLLTEPASRGDTRLLGVTPDKRHVWLFEPATGEITRQTFIDPRQFTRAFGDGVQLLHDDVLPPSQQEWEDWTFADVSLDGSGLRGVSVEGVMLTLTFDHGERITGVNNAWVAAQGEQLVERLQTLLETFEHEAFVSVESGPGRLQWYDVQRARLIQIADADLPADFDLLGTRRQAQVLLHQRGDGIVQSYPARQRLGPFDYLQRNAKVLVVEGQMRIGDLLPLLPDGVNTLVLRLGQGALFHLSRALWLRLQSVIVDCRHAASETITLPGKLNWALQSPQKLQLEIVEEHLVIIDPDTEHSLILRDVFSTDSALCGEVFLGFDGQFSLPVSRLVQKMRGRQASATMATMEELLAVAVA